MLCGKTPLTHTLAWQLGLSYGPGGSTGLSHDHCNDLKGQLPQQAEATPTSWTALWKMQFGSLHNMWCILPSGWNLKKERKRKKKEKQQKKAGQTDYTKAIAAKAKQTNKKGQMCLYFWSTMLFGIHITSSCYQCESHVLNVLFVIVVRGSSIKRQLFWHSFLSVKLFGNV